MNKEEIKKRLKHRETYYKQVGEVAKELLELLGTVEEVFNEPISVSYTHLKRKTKREI